MSSSAPGGPPTAQEAKKQGVGKKLLSRVKTVLKKADPSRRSSAIPTAVAVARPSTQASAPVAQAPSQTLSAPAPTEGAKKADELPPGAKKIPRTTIHEERARKLAERFGLQIDPGDWYPTDGHVIRIEKPIRMRVHRQCHRCQSFFGFSGDCSKCGHSFCKHCLRYPPVRTEAEKLASRERMAAVLKERAENPMIIPDWNLDPNEKIVLRRPGKLGGQELVYKPPRQRVRRTCCKCMDGEVASLFTSGKKTCPKCGHTRCTDCPRDPACKKNYPYGYPGDELGDKSTPHHRCHMCRAKFPAGAANGTQCANCQHEKCSVCKRIQPRKIEPDPDPEILKSVQERLAALNFS